ncbi:MAG: DUF86 domain-containing protein, partial [Candidatus Thermoplasmatota archaeon]
EKNIERRYSIAFVLEQIVNECINLGNHIISEKELGQPESYKDIFEILAKNGLISKAVAEDMKYFVEVRNIIAHRYGKFPNRDLLNAVRKRKYIEKFTQQLVKKI